MVCVSEGECSGAREGECVVAREGECAGGREGEEERSRSENSIEGVIAA